MIEVLLDFLIKSQGDRRREVLSEVTEAVIILTLPSKNLGHRLRQSKEVLIITFYLGTLVEAVKSYGSAIINIRSESSSDISPTS